MAVLLFSFSVFLKVFLIHVYTVNGEIGILYVRSGEDNSREATICIAYNPKFHTLPTDYDLTKPQLLANRSASFGCEDIYDDSVQDHIVAVLRGNCTFAEKATFVQKHSGTGLVAINNENETSLTVPGGTEDDYRNITIIVATMLWKDFQSLNDFGDKIYFSMYSPVPPKVDPNMACIFLIAVFCVGVGAYWSGIVKNEIKKNKSSSTKSTDKDDEDEDSVNLSPVALIILVILLCAMLISLYFFYDYLVYAIIGLFTIAGSVGLYFCIQPLWDKLIPCNLQLPISKVPCCSQPPEIRGIILYSLCLSLSIFWAVQRHESYAWILQDILGAAFSINMLKTVRLPSLKMCTILLVLLFFYDIFFVFITPLFTKTGKSVMVDVATGGNSSTGEQLPMVFKFPRLLTSAVSMCSDQPFSLLGFGDVLVPGLLIAYNHGFDIEMGTNKIYYISSLIAYTVGLGFTFIALAFMETGQPALLYLVPCTLITTFVVGCRRREFRRLWSSEKCSKKDDNIRQGDCQTPNVDVSQTSVNGSSSTLSTDGGEERVLIR